MHKLQPYADGKAISATGDTSRDCWRTSTIKAFLLRPGEREKVQSCQLGHFSQDERTWQKKRKD